MRMRFLVVLQLGTLMILPGLSCAQSKGIFTESQSLLLFSGDSGGLLVASPTGNIAVPHPPGWIPQYASPLPALAPAGDQVAWSIEFPVGFVFVPCSRPGCVQPRSAKYKSVMGVYSVHDKAWKLFGDFCSVGSAAFSPDGKKVAFKAKTRSGNPECTYRDNSETLLILDLETGRFTPVPDSGAVNGMAQLSWSPDGKYLAVSLSPKEDKSPGLIGLIEMGSWVQKIIAEGTDPSWSPKGDWIAYYANWNETCTLIHSDGTGAKVVLDLRHRSWGGRLSGGWVFHDQAVWSPDGEKLLLNEHLMDTVDYEVAMLDLTTGKATRKSKKSRVVFGWVPKSGD